MPGFQRWFTGSFPAVEVIKQIEGAFVIDLPPAGSVEGVGTGRVALVAEFADMAKAVAVSSTGLISTKSQPTQVFGGQDLIDTIGGFDELIGDFGKSMGNGFVSLRNKRFAELVVLPVNLCSTRGVRVTRELPTNKSAADPNPIVQVQGAVASAGREFKSGSNRVRLGTKVTFGNSPAITTGITGSVPAVGPVATVLLTVAGETFVTKGVKVGDALVLGVLSGAGALGANAGTFRITALTETTITYQSQSGVPITTLVDAAVVYRVHKGDTADSGGAFATTSDSGYPTPVRNLDAVIAASTLLTPTVVPTANSATSWDTLSGLKALVTQNATGLAAPTAAQAPNTTANATLEALYDGAFDSMLNDVAPTNDIDMVTVGRSSDVIRTKVRSHVLEATRRGLPRMGIVSPPLDTVQSVNNAIAGASPGVGAYRSERIVYSWPGLQTFIPEAVGLSIATADGSTTADGSLDVFASGWAASLMSNLAPERSIAQGAEPVPTLMSPVTSLQRGAPVMGIEEYIALKNAGICAPKYDAQLGSFLFQSAITTSLTSGETDINRRRFADFVELSLVRRYSAFVNLPMTDAWKDSILTETVQFYSDLLSEDNKAAQRISGYSVDPNSANTEDREGQGIYIVASQCKMTPIGKFIGVLAEIGPTVKITTTI